MSRQKKKPVCTPFPRGFEKRTHSPSGTKAGPASLNLENPSRTLEKPSAKRFPPDSLSSANRAPAEERPPMFHHWIKPRRNGPPRCKFSIVREVAARQRFAANPKPPKQAPLGVNLPSAEAAEKRQTEAVHRESKPTKAAPSRRNFQIDEGAITRQRSAAGQAIPQPHPARTEPAPESNPFFPA